MDFDFYLSYWYLLSEFDSILSFELDHDCDYDRDYDCDYDCDCDCGYECVLSELDFYLDCDCGCHVDERKYDVREHDQSVEKPKVLNSNVNGSGYHVVKMRIQLDQ